MVLEIGRRGSIPLPSALALIGFNHKIILMDFEQKKFSKDLPMNEIIHLYTINLKSVYRLSKMFGVSEGMIKRLLLNNEIDIRHTIGCSKGCVPHNKGNTHNLQELAKESKRLIDTGEILKFTETCIRKHFKRYLIHKNGHQEHLQ